MPDQTQDTFDIPSSESPSVQSKGGIPFGGTISSIFLMGALSLGVYLLTVSITNDFPPDWKAAYWVATIATFAINLTWAVSLCGKYGLSAGHMLGGVVLSSLSVVSLLLLAWINHNAQGVVGNGEVLVAVLAATFGMAALGINVFRTN
ncbi:hypothetical protein X760_27790 [Mesorhizobium sp. LSHC422A00]|uniref:hypothetical protein n=1 Tax=Mesorhizobium sp. LSHC422A00 TaxID=1287294 RepID=UPI0003CE12B4|nr:hypothetical protein [Mesorhizobium sp. LSHC422A00]ESX54722.1 hypothetical protein X760_27790 [Mesorhizobium sp. LSHC422A00]